MVSCWLHPLNVAYTVYDSSIISSIGKKVIQVTAVMNIEHNLCTVFSVQFSEIIVLLELQ